MKSLTRYRKEWTKEEGKEKKSQREEEVRDIKDTFQFIPSHSSDYGSIKQTSQLSPLVFVLAHTLLIKGILINSLFLGLHYSIYEAHMRKQLLEPWPTWVLFTHTHRPCRNRS